jgi:hypothetical protein
VAVLETMELSILVYIMNKKIYTKAPVSTVAMTGCFRRYSTCSGWGPKWFSSASIKDRRSKRNIAN